MQFALTDQQRDLAASVRDFLADRFGPAEVRAVYDDPDGAGDPPELWKACGEQGWLAVVVPERFDGLGLGLLDAAVIARAWGESTVPGPWLSTVIAGEAIRLAGSPEQQSCWLPRLAAGDLKIALAARAPGGGWDTAGAACTASGEALSGSAAHVEYAHVADLLITATTDGRLWLVEPDAAGVRIERQGALDRTTRLCTVEFAGAPGQPLEPRAGALADLYRVGAVLVANDLVGVARGALRKTVDYDKDRVQFGKPVGSFQAIKHALADLHVAVTMAEHGALFAPFAIDTGLADAAAAVSIAKAKASDAARAATAAMIQFHGGIGYTWEHDAHFAFKRAKRAEYLYGDADYHREQLARLVFDQVP